MKTSPRFKTNTIKNDRDGSDGIFTPCPIYHVLIVLKFNDGTYSQIMLYFGILNGISVYLIGTMNQQWEVQAH